MFAIIIIREVAFLIKNKFSSQLKQRKEKEKKESRCPVKAEISLKVICDKSNFQTVIFAILFVTMNGHKYKFFKSIYNDVQAECEGR